MVPHICNNVLLSMQKLQEPGARQEMKVLENRDEVKKKAAGCCRQKHHLTAMCQHM